jgi:hypothetical protein
MPPRRRSAFGFKGVRPRPNGLFYAELRTAGFRLMLGTYNSPEEAAHAYDAATWRIGRPRRKMNFPETESLEEAQFLVPRPHLVTDEDRHRHRQVQRRLLIAEHDERAMAAWRREFLEDVQAELEFYRSKGRATGLPGRSPPAQSVYQRAARGADDHRRRRPKVGRPLDAVRGHHLG